MDQQQQQAFKERLDGTHTWPDSYTFKFIVPKGKEDAVIQLFDDNKVAMKESKKGNYVSVTANVLMQSSDEVMSLYLKAHTIEGIIAL